MDSAPNIGAWAMIIPQAETTNCTLWTHRRVKRTLEGRFPLSDLCAGSSALSSSGSPIPSKVESRAKEDVGWWIPARWSRWRSKKKPFPCKFRWVSYPEWAVSSQVRCPCRAGRLQSVKTQRCCRSFIWVGHQWCRILARGSVQLWTLQQ